MGIKFISNNLEEEFFPAYAELNRYGEYYITEINAENSFIITISIKSEQ